MPVEIRELQITTIVSSSSAQQSNNATAQAPDTDAIIAQCVEQVLDILKQKNER